MGGIFSSNSALKQVLLVGPPSSGKTTLLYSMVLPKKEFKASATNGFNYEQLTVDRHGTVAVWDIGGSFTVTIIALLEELFIVEHACGHILQEHRLLSDTIRDQPI